jgi:hypothetical protein
MKILPLFLLLLAGTPSILSAADVDVFAVIKTQFFAQTSAASPTLLPTEGFTFVSIVDANTSTSVTSATLRLPSLTVIPFGPTAGVGPLGIAQSFDTEAAMEAVYGSGSYLFTIATASQGTRTPSLSLTGSSYPTTPAITDFAAAQNIDWTQDFTLNWGAFSGGNALDYIQLIIRRSNNSQLFSTPDFGQTGALSGTATSTTIPANTFVPGETYTATLAFGNVIAVNIFAYDLTSGVPGVTAFAKTTTFPMKAPGTTPALKISKGTAVGAYDLTWNADLARRYDLRCSDDFATWTQVALVTADTTTELHTDTPPANVKARFYRLQEAP